MGLPSLWPVIYLGATCREDTGHFFLVLKREIVTYSSSFLDILVSGCDVLSCGIYSVNTRQAQPEEKAAKRKMTKQNRETI